MTFEELLTSELRRKSNTRYLFEEISNGYKSKMVKIFQKAIEDEIYSAVSYTKIAESLAGYNEDEISEEFIKHAKEESGDHFYELMEYASESGIVSELSVNFSFSSRKLPNINLDDIIQWKQELEYEAMTDYLNAAEIADKEGDMITKQFFIELSKDERRHISDLLRYTDIGQEYLTF